MAKIFNGILGSISGKIGGVVGGRWKNVPYIRGYTKGSPSETALQVAQRARFAYVVASAKYFVGTVFNPYYDKFLGNMSGFNRYVSENIPKSPGYAAIDNYTVTNGPLYPGSTLAATYDTATGTLHITHDTGLGVDGLDTDVSVMWARDRVNNIVYFGAESTRVTSPNDVALPAGLTATDLDVGYFLAQKTGTLVNKISRNLTCTATAA